MAASRIDDLRRRVESDPASIAFAQLAEEYRRAGQSEEAVRVCRDGLTRHPAYLSARVTLGRALLDLGDFEAAREELEFVAREAPENLAAVRGLAEILHREGALRDALEYYRRALALAPHDPELEEIVQQLARQVGADAVPSAGLSFEEAHQELLFAAERVPLVTPSAGPAGAAAGEGAPATFDFDKLVSALGSPTGPPMASPADAVDLQAAPLLPDLVLAAAPLADVALSDPFGALEAELRAREQAPPPARDLTAEAPPELVDADAAAVPPDGTPAEAPALATPVMSPDDLPPFGAMIEPSAAEPLPWIDPEADRAPRPWPWEPVAIEEVTTTEFFEVPESAIPTGQSAEAVADASVSDAPEIVEMGEAHPGKEVVHAAFEPPVTIVASHLVHESPAGGAEAHAVDDSPEAPVSAAAAGDGATPVTPAPEMGEPDGPTLADEDVLGDLEGWLETLAARSSQH